MAAEARSRRRRHSSSGLVASLLCAAVLSLLSAACFSHGSAVDFSGRLRPEAGVRRSSAAARSPGVSRPAGPAGPVIDAEEVQALSSAFLIGGQGLSASERGAPRKGKVALITGASTGIGLSTVEGLVGSGLYGTIIMAGRDAGKHQGAMEGMRQKFASLPAPVELRHLQLELDSLQSVRDFAARFLELKLPLHTLVLNAGVMAIPDRRMTKDGFEYQFGVNHLAHFLLANLVLDTMVAAGTPKDPSRVISLSSSAHQMPSPLLRGDLGDLQSQDYSAWGAYGQSKLANLLFAYELDRRCRDLGLPVSANAVHPGVVSTELARYLSGGAGGGLSLPPQLQNFAKPFLAYVLKTPEDGAKTSVRLATSSDGKLSGRYWQDSRPAASLDVDPTGDLPSAVSALLPFRPRLTSYDPEVWAQLWEESAALVGLKAEEVSCLKQS
ncbi:unnamed protein product [Polarella glacialis]|uniref:Protochlorophyllide reductase n=1 Tax=Polarella glacialis TaxID=89957 RepID=A0A813FEE3_POLGL|nr:unnamed protein product [Polarella glacialis]